MNSRNLTMIPGLGEQWGRDQIYPDHLDDYNISLTWIKAT